MPERQPEVKAVFQRQRGFWWPWLKAVHTGFLQMAFATFYIAVSVYSMRACAPFYL